MKNCIYKLTSPSGKVYITKKLLGKDTTGIDDNDSLHANI